MPIAFGAIIRILFFPLYNMRPKNIVLIRTDCNLVQLRKFLLFPLQYASQKYDFGYAPTALWGNHKSSLFSFLKYAQKKYNFR